MNTRTRNYYINYVRFLFANLRNSRKNRAMSKFAIDRFERRQKSLVLKCRLNSLFSTDEILHSANSYYINSTAKRTVQCTFRSFYRQKYVDVVKYLHRTKQSFSNNRQ